MINTFKRLLKWFVFIVAIACIAWWQDLMRRNDQNFVYRTVTIVHFTEQNWIPEIVYSIRCVIACKIGLQTETQKLHFCLRPSSSFTILNFSERSRQTQRYFNVSTPSSRRDNYGLSAANYINMLKNIVTWERQRNQHV